MPYPNPDTPWSGDFDYYLVALPRGIDFFRAVNDAFGQLGFASNWGREGTENQSYDSAQAFEEALLETWRLKDMGWPDVLLGYVDDVETKLQLLIDKPCCAESQPYSGPPATNQEDWYSPDDTGVDQTGGDIVVGTGTPPGGIADWPTYQDKLCKEATSFVDRFLPWLFNFLEDFFGVVTFLTWEALLALVITILSLLGLTAVAVFGVGTALGMMRTIRTLIENDDTTWDAYAAAVAANRETLICAIVQATTPAAANTAFEAALTAINPKIRDWVYSSLPMPFLIRRMFNADTDSEGAGGFGSGTNCGCGPAPADYESYTDFRNQGGEPPWSLVDTLKRAQGYSTYNGFNANCNLVNLIPGIPTGLYDVTITAEVSQLQAPPGGNGIARFEYPAGTAKATFQPSSQAVVTWTESFQMNFTGGQVRLASLQNSTDQINWASFRIELWTV